MKARSETHSTQKKAALDGAAFSEVEWDSSVRL